MNRHHLSREDMLRAIGMLEAGRRQIDVAEAFGTTQSVISRLLTRYRATDDVREHHSGRQRITTPQQDRYVQMSARRNPGATTNQLRDQLYQAHGIRVSRRTIGNRLHDVDLHCRRPWRAQPLNRGNRGSRLQWAQDHIDWDEDQWANVLFSDESRFGLHPDSRRVRVWRTPGNRQRMQHVQEVHSYRGGTIMVWAGISSAARTDLVLCDRFVNANSYINNILRPVVLPFAQNYGQNFVLMHDNARAHTAAATTEFLEEHQINVLPWPAQSPDLNPIEHAWDMLQRRVLQHVQNFDNRQQLFQALQAAWEEIPQEYFENIITSMGRRRRAVINARGGHIPY